MSSQTHHGTAILYAYIRVVLGIMCGHIWQSHQSCLGVVGICLNIRAEGWFSSSRVNMNSFTISSCKPSAYPWLSPPPHQKHEDERRAKPRETVLALKTPLILETSGPAVERGDRP